MKTFKNLCAAVTLIFALSFTSLAGEITTMVVPPPPPPASAMAPEPNDIDSKSTSESNYLITDITLTILRLLSVF